MKLSEAIRLNGMTKPQGYGVESMGSCDAPCALGGALQAIGKQLIGEHSSPEENYRRIAAEWPWTYKLTRTCPVCHDRETSVNIIWHLNDAHFWTRQQIADWVATVEPQEEPAVEVENVDRVTVAA